MPKRIPFNSANELVSQIAKNPEKYSKISCAICYDQRKELKLTIHYAHELTTEILSHSMEEFTKVQELKIPFVNCMNCCNTGFLFIERKEIRQRTININIVTKSGLIYPISKFKLANNIYKDKLVEKFNEIRKILKEIGAEEDIIFKETH